MGMNHVNPSSVGKNIINPGKKKASKALNQETKPEADQKQEHLAQPNSQHFRANFIVPQVGAKSSKQSSQKTYDYEAAFKKMTESCENKPNKKALLEAIKHLKIAMADETGSSYHIDGTNFHQVTTWFESAILSDKYETKEISEEFIVNVLKELKEHMNYYNSGNIVRLLASIDKDRIPQKEAGLVTELYDMFDYYNEDQRFNKEFMDSIAKKWNIGKESFEQTEPTIQPQEQPAINSLNPVDILSETVGPNSVNASGQPKQEIENIDSELTKEQKDFHDFVNSFIDEYDGENAESIGALKEAMTKTINGQEYYYIDRTNFQNFAMNLVSALENDTDNKITEDLLENILEQSLPFIDDNPENIGNIADVLRIALHKDYILDSELVEGLLGAFQKNIDENNAGNVALALKEALSNLYTLEKSTVEGLLEKFQGKINNKNANMVALALNEVLSKYNNLDSQLVNKLLGDFNKENIIDKNNAHNVATALKFALDKGKITDTKGKTLVKDLFEKCKSKLDENDISIKDIEKNYSNWISDTTEPLSQPALSEQVQQPTLNNEQLAKHNSFAAAFDTVVKKYEAKNQQLPERLQNLKDMMQQNIDGDYHYLINEKNVVRVTTSLLLARCQNKDDLIGNNLVENILTECKKYANPENVAVLARNLVWDISCRYIPVDSNGTIIVADFLENFKGNIDKNNLGDVSKALSWAMFRENIPKGQEGTHLVMEFLKEFKGKIDTNNLGDVAAMIERAIYNKNIPEDQEGNKIITELLKEFEGNIDTKNASRVANVLSIISYENVKKDQECISIIEKLLNECKQNIDKDMYTRLQAKFNFPETSPSSSTPLQVQQPAQTGEPLQKKSASAAYFKAAFDLIKEQSEELEILKEGMDVDGKGNYDINGKNINEVTSDFFLFLTSINDDSPKVYLEFAIKFLEYVKKDELFNGNVYNSSRVFMGVILEIGERINDENKKTILECIENCIQKDANSVVKAFNSIVMYDSDIFTDYEKKIFSKEILDKCIEKLGSGADPENIVKMINNLYSHTPITEEGGRKKDKNDFRIILETLKSKRVITNAKSAENIQRLLINGMRYGSDDDKLIDGTEEIVKDLADECQRYLKQLDFDLVTKLNQAKEKQIHTQEHPGKVEHKGAYSSRILQGPPSNFTPVNKGTTVQQPTQVTLQQSKLSTSLQKVKVLFNENVPEDFNNLEIALKNGTESPHIDRHNVENVLDKLATVLHNNRISSGDSASKFVINILQESTKFISFDDAVVDLEVFNDASHAAQNTAYALACAIINLDYIPRTDKNLIEYISKLCEDFSLPEGPNQPRTIIANCLAGMNMSSTTDTAQVQQHNQVEQKSPQNPRIIEGSPSRATVKTRSGSAPSMLQQPMLTREQAKSNNYFVQVFNGMISDGGQLPKELQELQKAMIQQRGGNYYYLIDKTNLFNVTENIVKALMQNSGKKNQISEQTLLYLIKECKDSIGLESSDGYKERANAVVFLLNSIVSLGRIKNTDNLKEIIKNLNIDKKLKEHLNSKLAQAITKNI